MALTFEEIGRRLREAREQVGLSQAQVAEFLELSRPAVSDIESGKRKVNSIEIAHLANLYGFPVSHFLSEQSGESVDQGLAALFRAREIDPKDREKLAWLNGFITDYCQLKRIWDGMNHGS
ncbi:MAG: helix-turn-helix transcriptional regulator [Clostridia bacterium]|nr:helix-turn-helix transcriptional regulator [Clostridia bacterium]